MSVINENEIRKIREDRELHERFIAEHKRFILASAYKAAGRFITESDDEYSVSLIAFEEAVRSFEADRGNFYSFAELVIRRRLYDYNKAEGRHSAEIPVRYFSDDEAAGEDELGAVDLEVRGKEAERSLLNSAGRPESTPIRDEIEAMQQVLDGYGFSFFDLTECSPRAEKTKAACAKAVRYLLSDRRVMMKMRQKHRFPVTKIYKNTEISPKILERYRNYIITVVEILAGDYPGLGEYLQSV